MKFRILDVAKALGAPMAPGAAASTMITGWSIDSRTIQPGDLFFALKGPNFDGHAYVGDVFAKGAVAAVVEHHAAALPASGVLLSVADTLAALQDLARWARDAWGGQVAGVTGSAGKTTTKDVIADMLAVAKRTARNEGNLNNHVGLPLSLLRLDESAEVAVLEMGMNHAGEIRRLAEICRPNVGVVTNVGYAHIENFESIDGIAAAKRELVEALGEEGIAVLNADDPLVAAMAKAHSGRTVLYGQSDIADIRAEEVAFSENGTRFRVGSTAFETSLPGRHNVSNILAGIATAEVYGIAPDALVETVRTLTPGKTRGERIEHRGITIFNDCYNSNPEAVRTMLEALRDRPARRRIAVHEELRLLEHAGIVLRVVAQPRTEEPADAALQPHPAVGFDAAEFLVVAQVFAVDGQVFALELDAAARADFQIGHALDLLRVDRGRALGPRRRRRRGRGGGWRLGHERRQGSLRPRERRARKQRQQRCKPGRRDLHRTNATRHVRRNLRSRKLAIFRERKVS